MALKYLNENPRVTDEIVFQFSTPDQTGCNLSDPYRLDKIVIYFVERGFLGTNFGEYEKVRYDNDLLAETIAAEKEACDDPTDENILNAQNLRSELELIAIRDTSYFKDAIAVATIGSADFPAWLSTDTDNAQVEHITEDAEGNTVYGQFEYTWRPEGSVRAGDYFVCWTWTPLPAGDRLSAHDNFILQGDPTSLITIPTHLTPDDKYTVLLERYLPSMYKEYMGDNDITPETLEKLNNALSDGFKFVEDFSSQLIDLLDANVLHESMLVYLSNLFNLKLRTSEPTLWRRQIKTAVQLFKQKGTLNGLKEAFAQANMTLNKLTMLYQVISPFTWVESFLVKESPTFNLKYIAVNPTSENFLVYLRRSGTDEYTQIGLDNLEFGTTNCDFNSVITWVGDEKSSGAMQLYSGDILKVQYLYNEIPPAKQSLEDFIQTLPLGDTRDEADQEYPPKNWNVRFIEEDDPMLPIICPVIHPFTEPVVFGHIRTEFPYSENVYNNEEYNGSIRESTNPCFIDKDWLDSCSCCLSSSYNLDVTIEDLSNDRLLELRDILREYTPFHARPFRINFSGEIVEFVQPPLENINQLININVVDYMLAGDIGGLFTRFMGDGVTNYEFDRSELAEINNVVVAQSGTAYNSGIGLIVPLYDLAHLGLNLSSHVLRVLAPSSNSGNYTIQQFMGQSAIVGGSFIEPLNEDGFTCSLFNITYSTSNASITQDDLFTFYDDEADYSDLTIHSLDDVDNGYASQAYTMSIPSYSATPYAIQKFENGKFILLDPGYTLPTVFSSGITYAIHDETDQPVYDSNTGKLQVERRGLVELNDSGIVDMNDFAEIGFYLNYSGQDYVINKLDGTDTFHITSYSGGSAAGVSVEILEPVFRQEIGYFNYYGLNIETLVDYEVQLNISNGTNFSGTILENNSFKENFLFKIGDYYYKIIEIDGTTIKLEGFLENWTTLTAGGSTVTFDILQFVKQPAVIDTTTYDQLDRRNREYILATIENQITNEVELMALSANDPTSFGESIQQQEEINFVIEYKNGNKQEGGINV